jgi:hypothetical protein
MAKKNRRRAPSAPSPTKRVRRKRRAPGKAAAATPTKKRRRASGGAAYNASAFNTAAYNQAPTFVPNVIGAIADWKARRKSPKYSKGGAVEPVPVPLDSFPPAVPQPDLSGTGDSELSPVSPIPDLSGLADDEAADVIKEWFFSNFEDPGQETPRGDGEFLYILGGPYDARGEMERAFSGFASKAAIRAAITDIESEAIVDWAPHGNRRLPPDDNDQEERLLPGARHLPLVGRMTLQAKGGPQTSTAQLHAEMLQRIDALEQAMARPRRRRGGIGDNNPPEPIEREPLSANELREIRQAMAVLKTQPSAPSSPSAEARAAVSLLAKFGHRLRSLARVTGAYVGRQADNFVTEAVKESGKRIVQSPFWLAVIHQLPPLAEIAHRWLESLGAHF